MGYTPRAAGPQGRRCRSRGSRGRVPQKSQGDLLLALLLSTVADKEQRGVPTPLPSDLARDIFLEPAKPSDSMEKYPEGMRKTRVRLENRETRFQRSQIRQPPDVTRLSAVGWPQQTAVMEKWGTAEAGRLPG